MENSHLNRLPAELRNRIYELVVVQEQSIPVIIGPINGHPGGVRSGSLPGSEARTSINLLHTCKQVKAESQPLFSGSNTFELYALPENAAQALENFVLNTTTKRNLFLLRRLKVNVDHVLQINPVRPVALAESPVLEHVLHAAVAQAPDLPPCQIVVVFETMYYSRLPPLQLEIDSSTIAKSMARCLDRIDQARRTHATDAIPYSSTPLSASEWATTCSRLDLMKEILEAGLDRLDGQQEVGGNHLEAGTDEKRDR